MSNRPASIKNRVRAVILWTSIIVLLASASAFVLYDVLTFKSQLVRDLSTLAAVIADNSAAPLAFDSQPTAEEILRALKAEPDITAAALYDSVGNVFAKYPSKLETNLLPSRLAVAGHRFQDNSLILFTPVIQERKQIGVLYLRSSLEGLYARFWRYGGIVAAVLVGSFLTAFVVSTFLQKRISTPILALTKAAKTVAEHEDYSVRAPKLTEDELGTLTDAFNRMLAETQEHQGRLAEQARLLDLSNDAIMVRDAQGRVVYWNRGAQEIYGWTSAEAVGKMKAELLRTEFPQPLEEIEARLRRDGRWLGELVQTRRDGTRIHVITRWALDRQAAPAVANVLITDNDITARKQSEEALRESEERFRALSDNIAQLAWMADATGSIFWFNKRWYDYTGTTFEQMQGWGWEKVHHPDHLEAMKAKWKSHLERGEGWEDTFPLRGRDEQYRWFLSHAFPIRDGQGRIVRWFGTHTDITERKMSEEELERLVQERTAKLQETITELEAFSYSISHDMRAPLRAMQGYAELLLEEHIDQLDSEPAQYLERICRASNRLDSLIRDVLAYSRVAKAELVLQPVDLGRLIEDILPNHPEFQPPLARVVVEKPLHRVLGHEAYLTQIVTNLLGNAVKFVKTGVVPEIHIRSERLNGKVRVWFEDNGIGIDPAHRERIFQIFGQVYAGEKYGGTGIGLAIVRKAAQRMGGETGVESELGKGSRFWLILNGVKDDDESRNTVG